MYTSEIKNSFLFFENQCCIFSWSQPLLASINQTNIASFTYRGPTWPILLDTEKINPTKRGVSKRAAAKPNTDEGSTSVNPNVARTNISDSHVKSPNCAVQRRPRSAPSSSSSLGSTTWKTLIRGRRQDKNTNKLVEISCGIKHLEDDRDKQTTNQENVHQDLDDSSRENVSITSIKAKCGLTVLQNELGHVAPRHLQSCPLLAMHPIPRKIEIA
ncbi:hypothetical protein EDB83DRAFT_1649264 [Lactarius deliciosus]|nr:hypothetical protein EDB83DRAFT_1649264 [Lactarius deliciosus]